MTLDQKRREISTAIKSKQAISFTYNGEQREGNPHTLGYLQSKDPKYSLRLYQTDGSTSSKLKKKDSAGDNFRLFHVEEMDDIEKLINIFSPHPAFKTKDEAFDWNRKGVNRSIEVETD